MLHGAAWIVGRRRVALPTLALNLFRRWEKPAQLRAPNGVKFREKQGLLTTRPQAQGAGGLGAGLIAELARRDVTGVRA